MLTIQIVILHDLVSGGTSTRDAAVIAHVTWEENHCEYFLLKEQLSTWISLVKMFFIYVCLHLGKCFKFP